ncbi:ComF family protein [Oricola cellulosilytica]|uniref:ComF family protein n=2 Tax=Oricola cellulosilytica TaxID=1429082 RepID=A0A4R0P9Q7_9HYPH|nr:ComF family protein [Oricola cellulosilytica]
MASHMQTLTQKASRLIALALFPDTCLGCRRHVSERGVLCAECWNGMHFVAEPLCAITGEPFQHDFGGNMVSAAAIANPPAYRRARAAVLHTGVARQLAQRLKYGDQGELAPWMARWMVRAAGAMMSESDVVVPVPLHWRRYLLRRYNQSAELGRAVAQQAGLDFAPEALLRVKPTRRQVGLSAAERRRNVRGAFRVPPEKEIAVRGRRVLVVDDVLTTGSTIDAAAKALLRAGASSIDILAFSRVVPHFVARR